MAHSQNPLPAPGDHPDEEKKHDAPEAPALQGGAGAPAARQDAGAVVPPLPGAVHPAPPANGANVPLAPAVDDAKEEKNPEQKQEAKKVPRKPVEREVNLVKERTQKVTLTDPNLNLIENRVLRKFLQEKGFHLGNVPIQEITTFNTKLRLLYEQSMGLDKEDRNKALDERMNVLLNEFLNKLDENQLIPLHLSSENNEAIYDEQDRISTIYLLSFKSTLAEDKLDAALQDPTDEKYSSYSSQYLRKVLIENGTVIDPSRLTEEVPIDTRAPHQGNINPNRLDNILNQPEGQLRKSLVALKSSKIDLDQKAGQEEKDLRNEQKEEQAVITQPEFLTLQNMRAIESFQNPGAKENDYRTLVKAIQKSHSLAPSLGNLLTQAQKLSRALSTLDLDATTRNNINEYAKDLNAIEQNAKMHLVVLESQKAQWETYRRIIINYSGLNKNDIATRIGAELGLDANDRAVVAKTKYIWEILRTPPQKFYPDSNSPNFQDNINKTQQILQTVQQGKQQLTNLAEVRRQEQQGNYQKVGYHLDEKIEVTTAAKLSEELKKLRTSSEDELENLAELQSAENVRFRDEPIPRGKVILHTFQHSKDTKFAYSEQDIYASGSNEPISYKIDIHTTPISALMGSISFKSKYVQEMISAYKLDPEISTQVDEIRQKAHEEGKPDNPFPEVHKLFWRHFTEIPVTKQGIENYIRERYKGKSVDLSFFTSISNMADNLYKDYEKNTSAEYPSGNKYIHKTVTLPNKDYMDLAARAVEQYRKRADSASGPMLITACKDYKLLQSIILYCRAQIPPVACENRTNVIYNPTDTEIQATQLHLKTGGNQAVKGYSRADEEKLGKDLTDFREEVKSEGAATFKPKM